MSYTSKGTKKESFYLYQNDMAYIEDYAEQHSLNKSEAIRNILKEHKLNTYINSDELHNRLAEGIYNNLKNDFASIKFIDFNIQLIVEMLNCFLINNLKDNDNIISSDEFKSPILELAEKTIQDKIYKNYYIKNKEVK